MIFIKYVEETLLLSYGNLSLFPRIWGLILDGYTIMLWHHVQI